MATPTEFAQACKEQSRLLRRLPKDLRRELGGEVQRTVAEPLAADIRAAWRGPYGPALSAATKARVSADPQIVVGGARRVVHGGANARQLVYGAEFGGGKRVTAIPARSGRRGHRRRTTRQFAGPGQAAIFGTVAATLDRTFERWADAVAKVIGESMDHG